METETVALTAVLWSPSHLVASALKMAHTTSFIKVLNIVVSPHPLSLPEFVQMMTAK